MEKLLFCHLLVRIDEVIQKVIRSPVIRSDAIPEFTLENTLKTNEYVCVFFHSNLNGKAYFTEKSATVPIGEWGRVFPEDLYKRISECLEEVIRTGRRESQFTEVYVTDYVL